MDSRELQILNVSFSSSSSETDSCDNFTECINTCLKDDIDEDKLIDKLVISFEDFEIPQLENTCPNVTISKGMYCCSNVIECIQLNRNSAANGISFLCRSTTCYKNSSGKSFTSLS